MEFVSACGNLNAAVLPTSTDIAQQREISDQRIKWAEFLRTKNGDWSETWLWQYWRKESRQNNFQKKFMSMFSSNIQSQKKVKTLTRNGVPPELRGDVWWACSGAAEKMKKTPIGEQYGSLVQRLGELDGTSVAHDIEKDLRRTFPGNSFTESPEGILSLRKILRAYALRNPLIGYCQSMNYLCALLLFHMPEERAFWVLTALIEDILLPDYYEPYMLGSRVDLQVFYSCIAWKLPQIHQKLKETNTNLEPVICPWFMCSYINILPLHTVCRIWDCVFREGSIVLLRVGLSLINSKAADLREASDLMSVYMLLKSGSSGKPSFEMENLENDASATGPSSATVLLDDCFRRKFGRGKIEQLRTKFRVLLFAKDQAHAAAIAAQQGGVTPPASPSSSSASSGAAGESVVSSSSSSSSSSVVAGVSGVRKTRRGDRSSVKSDLMLRALQSEGIHELTIMAAQMDEGLLSEVEAGACELSGGAGAAEVEGEEDD